jgi:anti-sigma factor RsiW
MNTQRIDCEQARLLLHDEQLGKLPDAQSAAVREHLRTCSACARVDAEERVLSDLLHAHLPPMAAPARLRERLSTQLGVAQLGIASKPARRARTPLIAGSFSAVAMVAAAWLLWPHAAIDARDPLLREAVNDHLRVLYAQRPIEIESGGIHQVKPWFTGRLDFAPDLVFSGDEEFPMVGGAIGYMIDRKAATFVFKRRLHTISLFVFPSRGLDWPHTAARTIGSVPAQVAEADGFHVVLWRNADLGHALVSDASIDELLHLGRKIIETR